MTTVRPTCLRVTVCGAIRRRLGNFKPRVTAGAGAANGFPVLGITRRNLHAQAWAIRIVAPGSLRWVIETVAVVRTRSDQDATLPCPLKPSI
jgi:hypothetical protein